MSKNNANVIPLTSVVLLADWMPSYQRLGYTREEALVIARKCESIFQEVPQSLKNYVVRAKILADVCALNPSAYERELRERDELAELASTVIRRARQEHPEESSEASLARGYLALNDALKTLEGVQKRAQILILKGHRK